MKPKKILLVFAIIFTVLAALFGVETIVFFVGPDDSYAYLDELTYNEGVVKQVTKDNEVINSIYIEDSSVKLSVYLDMVTDVETFQNIKEGDIVKFSLSKLSQKTFEEGSNEGVMVLVLSKDDTEIIPIDAFGKRNEESRKVAQTMGICSTSIFVLISGLFYLLWGKSVRKYRK